MANLRTSLSIQTFEKLIEEERIYVDKTALLHQLIISDTTACFLSRPRRFGKSLTISTLDAIFNGKKHLFKNLAITQEKDWDKVIKELNNLIATIPGNLHIPKENYYHSLIHMIFQMSGLELRSEEWVTGGRIDTVIEEPDCFYIIEFKFDATAQATIDQIKTRRYSDKFQADGKPIYALGIAVDCLKKVISEWKLVNTTDNTP